MPGLDPVRVVRPGRSRDWTVLQACPGDVGAVAALRLALFREESGRPLFTTLPPAADVEGEFVEMTRRQLQQAEAPVFLATASLDGERVPVGMVRCSLAAVSACFAPRRVAWLTAAYVVPARRRQGVLRELVTLALDWCRAHDVREVHLRCALDNDEGNAAWEALGFSPVATLRRLDLAD